MWDMAVMWDVGWQPVNYWFLFVKYPSLSLWKPLSDSKFRGSARRPSEHNSAVPSLAASAAVWGRGWKGKLSRRLEKAGGKRRGNQGEEAVFKACSRHARGKKWVTR